MDIDSDAKQTRCTPSKQIHFLSYAMRNMEQILWGSHIRISELSRSLGAHLLHGGRKKRLLNTTRMIRNLFRANSTIMFDYSPTLYDWFIIRCLRQRSHLLFDIADVPHLQASYFGVQLNDRTYTKLERDFNKLAEISDILLLISPSLAGLLDPKLRNKKVIFVPNASNPQHFISSPLLRDGKKIILFVGNYAPYRGIESLIAAYKILREKRNDVTLKIVGSNMPTNYLDEGIVIETQQFYADMPRVYSSSYTTVIPHIKNPYMDAALPIKLFDSMASSRPVISTNCYESENLIREEKCGIISGGTPKSLADSIDYILSSPSQSQEFGENGRRAIEQRHSWDHRAQTILKTLYNL